MSYLWTIQHPEGQKQVLTVGSDPSSNLSFFPAFSDHTRRTLVSSFFSVRIRRVSDCCWWREKWHHLVPVLVLRASIEVWQYHPDDSSLMHQSEGTIVTSRHHLRDVSETDDVRFFLLPCFFVVHASCGTPCRMYTRAWRTRIAYSSSLSLRYQTDL